VIRVALVIALVIALAASAAASLPACASYTGSARDTTPAVLDDDPAWLAARGVPYHAQTSDVDCGAAAIAMVIAHWTGAAPADVAAPLRPVAPPGLAAGALRDLARARGLAAFLVAGALDDLAHELASGRPVLVGLVKPHRDDALQHFEVVVGLHRARGVVVTLDPAAGWRQNTIEGFLAEWKPAKHLTLIVSAPPAGPTGGTP
jgi:ABC-type bacteriocin/lantibiotic exporter with double-glycine peptidase domain